MTRRKVGFIATHWLVARSPRGHLTGVSADHPGYGPGFIRAHELAGSTITRLTTEELTTLHRPPPKAPASTYPQPWPDDHPFGGS